MIQYILSFAIFLIYAFYEGKREAYYYFSANKTGDSSISNIHWIYFVQRMFFVCIILLLLDESLPVKACLLFSMIGCFGFIHDGSYFQTRNNLDHKDYPMRWFDSSSTSTAFFEFNYRERLLYFILGIIIFSSSIFLKTILL